ncbi:hypothetical protein ARAM_000325 [Aspergillus rambellii]|uniref:Pre-mRNA-splicing factor n=1 Tax=Aspergillus rambellii TaxID=308745 RepID=A0A0F8WSQ8_9EURO|nr:hypothetical protein ARAM_000325 [Aspergillus rambellii]
MSSSTPSRDGNKTAAGLSMKPVTLSRGGSSTPNGQAKKPTSFNFQSSARATEGVSQTLAQRPHRLHHDSDDDDPDQGGEPAFESVTGFDTLTGKTISADGTSSEKKPLTIPVASNNNWRDRPGVRKPKGKNLLPQEVQALQEAQRKGQVPGNDNVETTGASMSYGLSFARESQGPAAQTGRTDEDERMEDVVVATPLEERKPLTEDEIALRALVRESQGEVEARSDLVIESRQAGNEDGPFETYGNETRSFRADIAARPEPATLDQYNAIPVEEFGAALLRGMGWKEGEAVGKGSYGSSDSSRATTPRIPARRPGFLGIGAKDSSGKGAEAELGAWGKSAMRKGARKAGEGKEGNTDGVYMPVLMRNTKTGEMITEEELATLKKDSKQQHDDDDWKERRDRNLERNGRDRDRDRDRNYRRLENEKGRGDARSESRRVRSSRRDRSRSSGDRDSRQRRYKDEDGDGRDDRYYRDRDRDQDRDRDRRSDRDRERERERDRDRDPKRHKYYDDDRYSSRHSSSNGSSRHRDRDRDHDGDRDSHRRRKYDD